MTELPRVYILHENPDWLPPFTAAFAAEGVAAEEVLLTRGSIDLDAEPAPGVYWSRMSASAHSRGNVHSKDYTRAYLRWLEDSGRRVVNGGDTINFEVSKVQQHRALRAAGFDVPKTVAVFGRDDLRERSREFATPFITKHNQGGKGLGVRRFDSFEEFDAYLASPLFEEPADGITLLQEYLPAERPFITRVEFVGGRYVYAVRVDISAGSFELCPADACVIDPGNDAAPVEPFALRKGFDSDPLIARYEAFLADHGIEIAGIEFIETADGRRVTYDVNTNTNYNPAVEASAPLPAARAIARFLGGLLTASVPA
ncbi:MULTISPECIES: RimK family alpha-L-glutamate ligase [unclassified Cryobacterium]|uniref:ATP-grasp domain-containing protein n=1 Tax=unclassified Cryobacterium TaxID=2649013 RepID=UPI00106BAB1D|nr:MULTISPECIES: alpha-L-glutamate ligase [unclassified Cryobacterium]TFB97360.1 alpha-L-glutamate ligase [Cryobacterium sp. MDB2-A-1]TFC02247.1 alpha-L-glutamate ligase [Cryobacterium sp. MDB2-33-2]TFC09962.1 alpha-L-glutamate ligase [Cryobacterium sp. MDB2-A-2]TFC22142.1 alpha-L-glutamate ligase [Cryobacterium sp. MDB2-10]